MGGVDGTCGEGSACVEDVVVVVEEVVYLVEFVVEEMEFVPGAPLSG